MVMAGNLSIEALKTIRLDKESGLCGRAAARYEEAFQDSRSRMGGQQPMPTEQFDRLGQIR